MYLSSASSRLLLHDTSSWDLKKSYTRYDGVLRDISWSDDSKYILQVNSAGIIEILSPADHDLKSLQHIPMKETWSACFHRDGHRNVAVGTKNGSIKIWDTKNKTTTKTFPTLSQPSCVNILSYNAKNTHLAATMMNGDTVIYSLVSNVKASTVQLHHSKSVSAMKFHHESCSLLGMATDEGHVIIRDITTNKDKAFFENIHASPVSDFAFSPINKDVLLSSGSDKLIQVYDIRLHNVVSTVRTTYPLTSIAINLENQVALGTKDGLILIYDLRDITNPHKILKGHEEEVCKVSFQPPNRRKIFSSELSLREEVDADFFSKGPSPVKTRTSDMFLMNDTPPKLNIDKPGPSETRDDCSFFDMLQSDESNNFFEKEVNKMTNFGRKSDHDVRNQQLQEGINISKVSTPINSKIADNFGSPIIIPSIPIISINGDEDKRGSNNYLSNKKPMDNINTMNNDDFKDFIRLSLSYISDDMKNDFMTIMMAFTKQNLFLQKELSNLNKKVDTLTQNMNIVMESYRMLTLKQTDLSKQNNL